MCNEATKVENGVSGYCGDSPFPNEKAPKKQMVYTCGICTLKGKGWGRREGDLEAVEPALLLFLVAVVESSHASLEMSALGFNAQTSIALLFDGLE